MASTRSSAADQTKMMMGSEGGGGGSSSRITRNKETSSKGTNNKMIKLATNIVPFFSVLIIISWLPAAPAASPSARAPPKAPPAPPHPRLCSSCGAVVQELLLALDTEISQSGVEFDGAAVNPDGSISGMPQEVNVELTEERVLSILDGLCERMTDYHLYQTEFVKLSEGSSMPTENREERKAKKALKKYCVALVEEHEDLLMSAIEGKEIDGTNSGGTEQSPLRLIASELCGKRTNACNAKQLRAQEEKIKSHLEEEESSSSTRGRQRKPTDEEQEGISAVPGN